MAQSKQFSSTQERDEMILSQVEEFSGLLAESSNIFSDTCSLWPDKTRNSEAERDIMFQQLRNLREANILCDATFLVGPEKEGMSAHRIVLCAYYDYFNKMFTSGLKESSQQEVCLPFVSPDDMKLVLDYAYNGKADISRENIHKVMAIGQFFASKPLIDQGYNFIRKFINVDNCCNLLQFALKFDFDQLVKDMKLFISYHIEEVHATNPDFWQLPVSVLLDIIRHPACVVCDGDPQKNEKQLFTLMWNKISKLPQEEQNTHILALLKAVHLPQIGYGFLAYIEKRVGHIPEAMDLLKEARKVVKPDETREWYLHRYKTSVVLRQSYQTSILQLPGNNTADCYSNCVLVKGLPWFLYDDRLRRGRTLCCALNSPVAAQISNLPYQVLARVIDKEKGTVLYDGEAVGASFPDRGSVRLEIKFVASCD